MLYWKFKSEIKLSAIYLLSIPFDSSVYLKFSLRYACFNFSLKALKLFIEVINSLLFMSYCLASEIEVDKF